MTKRTNSDDNFSPRPPDYRVWAARSNSIHRGVIGSAWKLADGTIGIKLKPFVVLAAVDELVVRLYPHNPNDWERQQQDDDSVAPGDDISF